jgi:serine/threonine protein kinase
VIHRDIKPENILVSPTGHMCITDYGLAKDFSNFKHVRPGPEMLKVHTFAGTPEYYAPEMIVNFDPKTYTVEPGYGFEVDIWSLGVVFLDMFVGRKRNTLFFYGDSPPLQSRAELMNLLMNNIVNMPLELDKWVEDTSARHLLYRASITSVHFLCGVKNLTILFL